MRCWVWIELEAHEVQRPVGRGKRRSADAGIPIRFATRRVPPLMQQPRISVQVVFGRNADGAMHGMRRGGNDWRARACGPFANGRQQWIGPRGGGLKSHLRADARGALSLSIVINRDGASASAGRLRDAMLGDDIGIESEAHEVKGAIR